MISFYQWYLSTSEACNFLCLSPKSNDVSSTYFHYLTHSLSIRCAAIWATLACRQGLHLKERRATLLEVTRYLEDFMKRSHFPKMYCLLPFELWCGREINTYAIWDITMGISFLLKLNLYNSFSCILCEIPALYAGNWSPGRSLQQLSDLVNTVLLALAAMTPTST